MQLTRRRIIASAIELIEREGVDAVSMSRLATELGCGLMILYHHVPSKSALLDGVAADVLDGLPVSRVPGGWAEQIRAQAAAFRRTARAHPRCAMLALSGRPCATGVARPAEAALAGLREAGFSGPDAVRIVRAFAAYLAGSLLCEVGVAPGVREEDDAARGAPHLRAADFPVLTSLTAELRGRDPDADFEFGLELLMSAVRARPSAFDCRTAR